MKSNFAVAATIALAGLATFGGAAMAQTTPEKMATPSMQMQAVLDKLAELGAKPLGTLSVEETRKQPTPADAVKAVMKDKGITAPEAITAVKTRDFTIPGADGPVPARLYTPATGDGPFPLIVYFHGGGWVIANIDVYDASPRALVVGTDAIVVSVSYRQAPEFKFPAAHDDVIAAYKWIVENSGELNGDATKIAVVGESAGGNLAANVAIAARDNGWTQPLHQVLIYPVAGNDMMTPSYEENADAQPLGKAGMAWFVEQVFNTKEETADPRLNLVARTDLAGLPPATIINAQIDPLRSEGEALAKALEAAGVAVTQKTYPAVTHEFFGMATVVDEARDAQALASGELRKAFGN